MSPLHDVILTLSRAKGKDLCILVGRAQAFFLILPALIVKDRDLLKPRMKITAYNQHDVGSFSSLGLFVTTNLLVATSQRRYAIKERSDEESAVFSCTPAKRQSSGFDRNDKQQGLFQELDFTHHLYETKKIRKPGTTRLTAFARRGTPTTADVNRSQTQIPA